MIWNDHLYSESLAWLLEPDEKQPSIRYHALRDLTGLAPESAALIEARAAIMATGPVPKILGNQSPDGYWDRPGTGYGKYRGTAWQIMQLGDLAADPNDERVRRGCDYLLSHSIASNHGFACSAQPVPSGVIHCLNGNLLTGLIQLGYQDDARVQAALAWQTTTILAGNNAGSGLGCRFNGGLPCAWGATKALKAFSALRAAQRGPEVLDAIALAAAFLLDHSLVTADFPNRGEVSKNWFKLGYPLSYWSDVLETLSVLVDLGYAGDDRLHRAYDWLLSRRTPDGRWVQEHALPGKVWVSYGSAGAPNKWITLRALRVVRAWESALAAA